MKFEKAVLLTGGLGNQLFQYTLSLQLGTNVSYLDFVAPNRRNKVGKPDLCDFVEGQRIEPRIVEVQGLIRNKLINLATRVSSRGNTPDFFQFCLETLLSAVILGKLTADPLTRISRGLGYDDRTLDGDLFIGYFQTYKYLEELSLTNFTLELAENSETLKHFESLSIHEKPLIVHYRLGDYLQETSFGVPAVKYYQAALSKALELKVTNKIWIFSDQLELAKELFPDEFRANARFVDTSYVSSAETLQLMRLGHAYVIANSSFSWWGAALSRTTNPIVVCPSPWFTNGLTPNQLFPPNWIVLNRDTGEPDTHR